MRCGCDVVRLGESKSDVLETCGEPASYEYLGVKATWYTTKVGSKTYGTAHEIPVECWIYAGSWSRFPYHLTFYGDTLSKIERGKR